MDRIVTCLDGDFFFLFRDGEYALVEEDLVFWDLGEKEVVEEGPSDYIS